MSRREAEGTSRSTQGSRARSRPTAVVSLVGLVAMASALAACKGILGLDDYTKGDAATPTVGNEFDGGTGDGKPVDTGTSDPLAVDARRSWARWKVQRTALDAGSYAVQDSLSVRDRTTGLVWERGFVQANDFVDALVHCRRDLGSGWDLPTRIELMTLVDPTRSGPAIEPTTFAGTPSAAFWTLSPFAGSRTDRWVVSFETGTASRGTGAYVRCVRTEGETP